MKRFYRYLLRLFNNFIERTELMTAFERIDTLEKAVAALTAQVAAIPATGDAVAIAAVDAKADAIRADLGVPDATA